MKTTAKVIALAWFAVVAACGRVDPAAELAAAQADFASGDVRTASVRVSNVLQSEPDNAEARLLRGQLALFIGDYGAAAADLRRARELGIALERLAVPLAQATARQGEASAALELLDEVQPALGNDAEYWIVRAEAESLAGRLEQAAQSLARAESGAPNGRHLVTRAWLASLRGDLATAETELEAAIARDARDVEAHAALGELYARSNRLDAASAEFDTAAEIAAATGRVALEARALLALVQINVTRNDLESAERAADRLVQRAPGASIAPYLRGLIEYRQGRLEAATASLQRALNASPDNAQVLTLLGAVQLAQGNLGQAEQHLLRVLNRSPRDPAAIKLLAETRLRQQRPSAALDALRPLAGTGVEDAQVGLLTGLANVLAGDVEEGLVYLEQAAALDPGNPLVKLELAKAYAAAGRHEDAATVLADGLGTGDATSELQARLLQLLSEARAGNVEEGNRGARALLDERPNDARAHIAAALYYQGINEPRQARELLERAIELDGSQILARLLLAGALVQEGRSGDAERRLREVIEREPGNAQALTTLARLAVERGDLPGAERLLVSASATPAATPRLMLAQLYIAQGRLDEAGQRLDEAARSAPDDAEVTAMRGLLALSRGTLPQAVSLLATAHSRLPERLGVALALAEAHVRSGDVQSARTVLANVAERAPQSVPVRAALGAVELRRGAADAALGIAKALQSEFPAERQGYLLEAHVEIARRRYDEGAALLRGVYDREPIWPVLADLMAALQLAGRPEESVGPLESWVARQPADVRARLALAAVLQGTGRLRDAIVHYESVLAIDERNLVALNNAAWVYNTLGDAKALPLAERALALAPDQPAVLDTLGVILVSQNRERDAIRHLERAAELAPQAPEIRYHLAQALHELGRTAEARATLQALLRDGQPFDDRAAAQSLLDEL